MSRIEGGIMSGRSKKVVCRENIAMTDFLCTKREELWAEGSPLAKTIQEAYNSLCSSPTPVTTAQEAKKLKHVGPWILRMLEPFLDGGGSAPTLRPGSRKPLGRNGKAKKPYCPAKNSCGYALLITLLRAYQSGKEFMRKQELIDEAEKSGLSTKSIRPNAIPRNAGAPPMKDMYSGWSSMKTLTEKCLVVRSSNPAKYKLTDEGKQLAQECLYRAGLNQDNSPGHEIVREEPRVSSAPLISGESGSGRQESSSSDDDIQEIHRSDVRQRHNIHFSSSQAGMRTDGANVASSKRHLLENTSLQSPPVVPATESSARADNIDSSQNKYGHYAVPATNVEGNATDEMGPVDPDFELAVPPLEAGEKFSDVYEIICIIDNREKFRTKLGTAAYTLLQRFADSLGTQFKVKVELRSLPVGDALWIARHKQHSEEEYVLDFVVERKNVHDLWSSIKDNRYKQQKLRMMNCGLKCLLYLVEGDVNAVESTEALKTAMFTTELQEGFRLLRTDDTNDTRKQYGHLTGAITSRYNMETGKRGKSGQVCRTYKGFVEYCKAVAKERVKDVFCLQLTQIAQVTEDIALSIQDRYPTIFSIAQAFSKLEGNQGLQEKMLQGIPIRNTSKPISAVMSKNIYKAIWAP